METSFPGIRIAVIGTSGSGKTTLAKRLSKIIGCAHIEIDSYAWNPGWIKNADSYILDKVREATKSPSWVVCGNYRITREIVWENATHIVWLKLPLLLILWRVFKRTLHNIITKKKVAGNNIETFYQQFFTKQSIFLWVFNTHRKRKKEYPILLEPYASKVLILKSLKEVNNWIAKINRISHN